MALDSRLTTLILDAVNRHRDDAPSDRIHLAALDIIEALEAADVPDEWISDFARTETLNIGGHDVDRSIDAAQRHTPFRLVRAEMHHILVEAALEDLVEAGDVQRELVH